MPLTELNIFLDFSLPCASSVILLANKNVKLGFMTGSKTILSSLALTESNVLATHLDTYITDELNDE